MTFNILHFCGSIQKDHSIEELSMLKDIMAQTVNTFSSIEIMLGYTLYSNTKVCFITEAYGITMNFLPFCPLGKYLLLLSINLTETTCFRFFKCELCRTFSILKHIQYNIRNVITYIL